MFNLSKVSNINSTTLVWHQILTSNFLPRNKNLDFVGSDVKTLILLLNSDLQINLPQVMFNYLKMTLMSFHEGMSFFIPYGRVMSELFI